MNRATHRPRPTADPLLHLVAVLTILLVVVGCIASASDDSQVAINLSPTTWMDDYQRYMAAQLTDRSQAGSASGNNGAVTVAYNALAARAGLEALKQGGNAIDAALTAALTQVALTAGAPISYFGILSLVYYDAASQQVHTMNAEWNTVLAEDKPLSIPGGINMMTDDGLKGTEPSGRTALVGGFMKGVEAAHERFGRLPFAQLFEPSIHIATHGMPVSEKMAGYFEFRGEDLKRLPETRAVFTKADGAFYAHDDVFQQPALAETLRAVATQGTDYMYKGPWAERLVAAVQADGGKMALEDLASYEVLWAKPLGAKLGKYEVYTNRPPNSGGTSLIEAQKLAHASGLVADGHWTQSGAALRKAVDITQLYTVDFLTDAVLENFFPKIDFSPESRITDQHAKSLWASMEAGAQITRWQDPGQDVGPKHSDDVVAIDKHGNIAAITQSINCVLWGKTAINIGGISIGDPASFQQAQIAKTEPGGRLASPTETGILFKDGEPVLGFASMGSGLHQRTFQGLLNVTEFGMSVEEAINTPDFFMPTINPATFQAVVRVPKGRFPKKVLDDMGYAYEEVAQGDVRFGGEGLWVAISRDPETGRLEAASHNRNNSDAVAY